MSANHMLHVGPGKWGGLEFSLTCIADRFQRSRDIPGDENKRFGCGGIHRRPCRRDIPALLRTRLTCGASSQGQHQAGKNDAKTPWDGMSPHQPVQRFGR